MPQGFFGFERCAFCRFIARAIVAECPSARAPHKGEARPTCARGRHVTRRGATPRSSIEGSARVWEQTLKLRQGANGCILVLLHVVEQDKNLHRRARPLDLVTWYIELRFAPFGRCYNKVPNKKTAPFRWRDVDPTNVNATERAFFVFRCIHLQNIRFVLFKFRLIFVNKNPRIGTTQNACVFCIVGGVPP